MKLTEKELDILNFCLETVKEMYKDDIQDRSDVELIKTIKRILKKFNLDSGENK